MPKRDVDDMFITLSIHTQLCKYVGVFIEAEWRIYTSVNQIIIGSDNGLSPVGRQSACLNQCWISVDRTSGNTFQRNLIFSFTKTSCAWNNPEIMGNIDRDQNTTKHNKSQTVCTIPGTYHILDNISKNLHIKSLGLNIIAIFHYGDILLSICVSC